VTPPPPSKEARLAQLQAQQTGPRLAMNFKGAYSSFNQGGRGLGMGGSGELGEDFHRAQRAHKALSHPYGDFHSYLQVYNEWERMGCSKQWCERNFVNSRSMVTVKSIR
jgi:hypothetical protein